MSAEMLMIVFFLKRRGRDLTFCSMVTVHTSCTALVILSAAKEKTGDFVRKCEQ